MSRSLKGCWARASFSWVRIRGFLRMIMTRNGVLLVHLKRAREMRTCLERCLSWFGITSQTRKTILLKILTATPTTALSSNKSDGESDGIVGWPPIKFKRKKLGRQNSRVLEVNRDGCEDCQARSSNSMYIKVKMDGAGIARKIDVSLYRSFPTLKHTLLDMFGICQENSSNYRLAYQDREGDWLLTEGVPWRNFLGSVQRLKLTRSSK
ncbi:hypothetical protein OIU77_029911 [Salix suchowensis]|uniref:Auxin-responsive protein n=1 Tax=Salix suchowensis TaxID=1278906 RepID=A0ABQ9BAI2_9ROSI|nr:hypothetical protein OIU77_029911 [Salix suchowensis]